jgi:hypothetical protein
LALASGLTLGWVWFSVSRFDPVKWEDESQVQKGVRLRMADGLIARQTLLGKTRTEVVDLLGEPPSTGYFSSWDMVYWLGTERAGYMSIDSEWLVLRLDDEGRVTENRILND